MGSVFRDKKYAEKRLLNRDTDKQRKNCGGCLVVGVTALNSNNLSSNRTLSSIHFKERWS